MQPGILLCTLNSSYKHSAFGLRYLYANLNDVQRENTEILEFTIAQKPRDIVEKILAKNPKLVGFGIYIWNAQESLAVISILKKVAPDILLIVGGPEVSYETESQDITGLVDYVFCGESDHSFRDFLAKLSLGQRPMEKIIRATIPEISQVKMPYSYYSNSDIANRIIYVEASRGCPYKCEYCLSSLDKSVRNFSLEPFLSAMQDLIQRGARQFKFVDRTFNLSPIISTKILEFFLERIELGLFLHFEMVPDRLPEELKALISKFPEGALQFEVGIQTWNPAVAALVSRRQDYEKIRQNFTFLKENARVHTHADLIVGLPGESLASFAHGFDSLLELGPDEIQVGLLKRLKGTPIIRHDKEWGMVYQAEQPFQILQTKSLSYLEMQKMNRFAKFWDLYANSGNFHLSMENWRANTSGSFFYAFMDFVTFLEGRHSDSFGISLQNLLESFWIYMGVKRSSEKDMIRELLIRDYSFVKKRDIPIFLRDNNTEVKTKISESPMNVKNAAVPKRQRQHLSAKSINEKN